MGFKKSWDVGNLTSQIHTLHRECSSPHNDGFTAWGCKQDLLLIQQLVNEAVKNSPFLEKLVFEFQTRHNYSCLRVHATLWLAIIGITAAVGVLSGPEEMEISSFSTLRWSNAFFKSSVKRPLEQTANLAIRGLARPNSLGQFFGSLCQRTEASGKVHGRSARPRG